MYRNQQRSGTWGKLVCSVGVIRKFRVIRVTLNNNDALEDRITVEMPYVN
jgi:hypothetical protein